jgi:alpha-1,3-rhamnosyl/mannosyltransferase
MLLIIEAWSVNVCRLGAFPFVIRDLPLQLKLIFNIEPLFGEMTGVGIFTRKMLEALAEQPKVETIRLFAGHLDRGDFNGETFSKSFKTGSAAAPKRRFAFTKYIPDAFLWSASRFVFWWRTLKLRDHIYIETNSISKPFAGKTVVFCHDLSVIRYRDYHPSRRVKFFDRYLEKSIREASDIAIISPPIGEEIKQRFKRNCSILAPPGTDPLPAASAVSERTLSVLDKLDGYILSVGSLEPRKNIEGLVNAFKQLARDTRKHYPLVFVGPEGWKNDSLLASLETLENKGEAIRLGYLSEEDLSAVYSSATLYAYLSHYEGFGIPVVEAMNAGVPVIANKDAALIFTAGDAAALVNGSNPEEVSQTIQRLLENPEERAHMIQRGYENIKRFSWSQSAKTLVDAIEKLK